MNKGMLKSIALSLIVGMGAVSAHANDVRNDLPSCYKSLGLEAPNVQGRDLIVIIDSTFDPDLNLKKMVHQKVHNFVRRGDAVSVVAFSGYVGDNYTQLKFSGRLETAMNNELRNSVSKKKLRKLDACLEKQMAFSRRNVDEAIKTSFKPEGEEKPKTEILANIAQVVLPFLKADGTEQARVLLVSDMLENSDVTSFYASGAVRSIDPDEEMAKVKEAGLLSDWQSARVFVIGAGWVPQQYRKAFRGSKVMRPLKDFWEKYFSESNANIMAFGQPVLMRELQ